MMGLRITLNSKQEDYKATHQNSWYIALSPFTSRVGILVDSEIVLSTRYGKTMVFINKNLINRDRLSTRPYQQRPLINKVDSW